MLCNICFEDLNKDVYSLIKHETDDIKQAKHRGHYFHNKCISKMALYVCPYDREKIKGF